MWCKIRQQALKSVLYVHMTNQSFKEQDACMHAHSLHSSMGFSKQEKWSGLACPPPGNFPESGTKPAPSTLQADSFTH